MDTVPQSMCEATTEESYPTIQEFSGKQGYREFKSQLYPIIYDEQDSDSPTHISCQLLGMQSTQIKDLVSGIVYREKEKNGKENVLYTNINNLQYSKNQEVCSAYSIPDNYPRDEIMIHILEFPASAVSIITFCKQNPCVVVELLEDSPDTIKKLWWKHRGHENRNCKQKRRGKRAHKSLQ